MADVVCPGCRGRYHETTDKFDPEVQPDGTMFRFKKQYGSQGWNWSGFALSASSVGGLLVCPNCDVPYGAYSGKVILDEPDEVPNADADDSDIGADDQSGDEMDKTDDSADITKDEDVTDDVLEVESVKDDSKSGGETESDDSPDPEPKEQDAADEDKTGNLFEADSGFVCPMCSKECKSGGGLSNHIAAKHPNMGDAQTKPVTEANDGAAI